MNFQKDKQDGPRTWNFVFETPPEKQRKIEKPFSQRLNDFAVTFYFSAMSLVLLLLILGFTHFFFFADFCRIMASFSDPRSANVTRLAFFGDPQIEGIHRVQREGLYGKFNNWLNDEFERWLFRSVISGFSPSAAVILGDLFSMQNLPDKEFNQRVARYKYIFEPPIDLQLVLNISGNHDIGYGFDANLRGVERFEREFGPVNGEFLLGGHHFVFINSQTLETAREKKLQQDVLEFIEEVFNQRENSRLRMVEVESPSNSSIMQRRSFRSLESFSVLPVDKTVKSEQDTHRLYRRKMFDDEQHLERSPPQIQIIDSWRELKYNTKWRDEEKKRLSLSPLILLLHIPLLKPPGTCVDPYKVEYSLEGSILEQTTLGAGSDFLLENLDPILIFNGHDHAGCFFIHSLGAKEYTVRSMMGEYGGSSAVLEIEEKRKKSKNGDQEASYFEYRVALCRFMPTWAVVTLFSTLFGWVVAGVLLPLLYSFVVSCTGFEAAKEKHN